MDKKCSPEEIEKKRLLALQRRQQSQLKAQNTSTILSDSSNVVRPVKLNNRFNPISRNPEPRNSSSFTLSVTGKCYMISEDRFALEVQFVPAIIETFKTIPSRNYDLKTRIWNFHINDYNSLLQKLAQSKDFKISVTKIPEAVLQVFKKNLKSNSQILEEEEDLSKIDEQLVGSLLPFQRVGVCYGISKHGRCIIADDMGLGKTIQALGIAHYFKDSWPLLIVVPSNVKFQWSSAINEFLPTIPAHYIHHFKNTRDCIDDDKITIISYDLLVRVIDTIEKHIYGFVILDESHVLKSRQTARFQTVRRICTHARHIVLLTGTPALSRPSELYSQISLIMPHFLSYEDYGERYCAGERSTYTGEFTGSSNMQELQMLLKVHCMIRRLKTDVLKQIPSKIRQMIILDSGLIKTGTKRMNEMSKKMEKHMAALEKHSTLIQYYNETSDVKLKAICNYVANLFESKTKCLLYAHHQIVMDGICNLAESMKIRYIRIDGKTNPEQRKLQVDLFQERDDCLAAILSITAANAGVTLTAAHLVVFTELFWNPGILRQAEDRVHRIGQNNSVTIQYLVAKNTSDDYMWPLIQKKMSVLKAGGLDQDFLIDSIEGSQQNKNKQRDLTSFLNSSSSSEKGSQQSQHDEEQKNSAVPKASVSNDIKDLLDIDEECFDSCDWDEI
ncbi:SWI/SNF-related matrix-associated actin-dependent regulator of chromatin subfamily A-like protein 1 isoform X2 [Solenopsis invicta]|uniref:SWI/SNF-related matrix-associated actin-dependent regulator of chromatin subfamily A-like protein 1 isoform X2 n=1 Tax=Solenopsis invicta TaxID=13686 RepID=UPI000E33FB9A|nr:SWI/SNF-related matrix-associated actin-dependent regulator of chromatin subfamily A-like protein 1 isoform X2 [Solenopsis invicta]